MVGTRTYIELLHAAFLEVDGRVIDVDDEVAVALTDAAVAVYDFASGVCEGWGDIYGVFETVTVAGGRVGLRGCGGGF